MASKQPLIVISGPTASGKTALAIELAEKYSGEIVCADSRTVYRGMNIGTAKPTYEQQSRVPHWGIDLVDPGEKYTANDFKQYALNKITEIRERGRIPFLVGGTGLYIDSVVFDYQFGAASNEELRRELELLTIEDLHKYCEDNNVVLPDNNKNKRYVIRSIERGSYQKTRQSVPIDNTFIVGITTSSHMLRTRIKQRTEQLFEDGVVNEAILLGKKYGWGIESMTGNIYPLIKSYVSQHETLEEVQAKAATLDRRLAKRQITWLRRNPYVFWCTIEDARSYLGELLLAAE